MSQSNEMIVAKSSQVDAQSTPATKPVQTAPASVKDAGRVHIGGGLMRF